MVIYPPVNISSNPKPYTLNPKPYFITVSRLARAKHVDVLIEAANKEKFNLHIVGIGRDEEYLKSLAGPTVSFLGNLTDENLLKQLQGARAFLFASVDEEFGIAPIEAMGYGVPVIAFASGGLKETVKEDLNGYLYNELSSESLVKSIQKIESLSEKEYIEMRKNARKESEQYSEENFKNQLMEFVKTHLPNTKP